MTETDKLRDELATLRQKVTIFHANQIEFSRCSCPRGLPCYMADALKEGA